MKKFKCINTQMSHEGKWFNRMDVLEKKWGRSWHDPGLITNQMIRDNIGVILGANIKNPIERQLRKR